jgi:hypothetical protein
VAKEDWFVRTGFGAELQALTRKFASSLVVLVKQAALEAVAGAIRQESIGLHEAPVAEVEEAEEADGDLLSPDSTRTPSSRPRDAGATTGTKKGTTSSYSGVTLFSNQRKYQAFVRVAKKRIHLGMWPNDTDAALARDRGALFFGLDVPLNLPEESNRLGPASPDDLRQLARRSAKATSSTSLYFGVTWDSRRRRWASVICPGEKKKIQIAQFDRAEDAAVAYDRVARSMFGEKALVNFPESTLPAASLQEIRVWARLLLKSRPTGKPGLTDPKERADDAAPRGSPDQIAGSPPSRPAEREPVDGAADRVLFFIRAKPGLRSEEVRAALGLDKDDMQNAIKVLLGKGKITKEGELRGTRYRPG